MSRPSFATTIAALRTRDSRVPWVGPTVDEADAADALEVIEEFHTGTADQADDLGKWGACTGCDEQWPCTTWWWGDQLALQWLGRAHDRVASRATTQAPA